MSDKVIKLAEELNFNFRQEGLFRTFGPRRDLVDWRPERGSEIFVARLPEDAFEDEIFKFFSVVGRIFRIKLFLTYQGCTKRYCFVEFMNSDEASLAIRMLNNAEFRPCVLIHVEKSTDHKTLLLTNTKQCTTTESVKEFVKVYTKGPFQVIPLINNSFYLQFKEHRDAVRAKLALLPYVPVLWGDTAFLDFEPNSDVLRRQKKKFKALKRKLYQFITMNMEFQQTSPVNETSSVTASSNQGFAQPSESGGENHDNTNLLETSCGTNDCIFCKSIRIEFAPY